MIIVCDSGPLIHLAQVNQFHLLKTFFSQLIIHQIVYEEVVSEGKNRAGEKELKEALDDGWIKIEKFLESSLLKATTKEGLSGKDSLVVALALEKKAGLFLSDDFKVRDVAANRRLSIIGTIGILTNAKLNGLIPNLKNLLDKLIEQGFHVDPQGVVYKDALKKVGEF
ncbi:MAG: hypothetical protein A2042_09605 [Candidatus Schekmanbacteria bacterium GWA2_38_11]|uniref:DUF3368 domain-containing protein n=1 Tax=Candidatus Schekmanbacteria bacterium GWA2_38_11 TaxID=1817876 RepID=A0A1F7RMJ7_9BACT|nr:MAG: hypothetical protein A2042_09605 [Candidatus Schekmanbacteria bacterium GWA2_38_11]